MGMRVRFAGETNVGRKRDHNEDSLLPARAERLAIVADGMGGHASGEVAAEDGGRHRRRAFFKTTEDEQTLTWPYKIDRRQRYDVNRLITGDQARQPAIYEKAQRDAALPRHGHDHRRDALPSTTACRRRTSATAAVYRFRDGKLEQLTEDHSLLNDYIKMKRLTPEEIANFPHKNVIVRALGMKETVQVDIIVEQPRLGDMYLLCSDGLSGMVDDPEIAEIRRQRGGSGHACERLIHAANRNGGVDNITVVAIRVEPE